MTTVPVPAPHPGISGEAGAPEYEHAETRALVALVDEAAALIAKLGDAAFIDLRRDGSRWRRGEAYVFVLDPEGRMLVHPDTTLEGRNVHDLQDVEGRPIIRGLIAAATELADRPAGWYHYLWPVPGGLLPRWKSSYVRLVRTPSGEARIVGSGMYDDSMERAFVADMVHRAAALIERDGTGAFDALRDPAGPFRVKDAYVFVAGMDGVEIVNPAFPYLEGRNLIEQRDAHGHPVDRELLAIVRTRGSGWLDYMWPRPGESVATRKSAFVTSAQLGGRRVMVGCGVYLPGAERAERPAAAMHAAELTALVREAAAMLEARGEAAHADLATPESKWRHGDVYFFVWTLDGRRVFHAAEPATVGDDSSGLTDVVGRPIGRMFLDVGASRSGEGWVHYLYPRPGSLFPSWKSAFLKRVTYPSGTRCLVGCGVYDLQMDPAFIEDLVRRAGDLVATRGRDAFPMLRDRTGPFVFMDTYVFVHDDAGTELVNPAQPALEGRSLIDLRDVTGRPVVREQVAAATPEGVWLECHWFRPGDNRPARKRTYVQRVLAGGETLIVGSGIYDDG